MHAVAQGVGKAIFSSAKDATVKFVKENATQAVVGHFADKAFDGAADFLKKDKSEEDKQKERAKALQAMVGGVETDSQAIMDRQKELLKEQRESVDKLQDAIKAQNGDIDKVWAMANSQSEIMKRQEGTLARIDGSIEELSGEMLGAMLDFNLELLQMKDMQQTVLKQIDVLGEKLKTDIKLGLAEHDAWKSQRNIMRFYSDFTLHVSIASAEVASGELEKLGDSPHIRAFVEALRSPVYGVSYELFNLKCANVLLDSEPASSRYAIEADLNAKVYAVQNAPDFKPGGPEYQKLLEAFHSAVETLIGAEIIAYLLINFISPNSIYRRRNAQAAITDLLGAFDRIYSLMPPNIGDAKASSNEDSLLLRNNGSGPYPRAWYLQAGSNAFLVCGSKRPEPHLQNIVSNPYTTQLGLRVYNRQGAMWAFERMPDHPRMSEGLYRMVAFRGKDNKDRRYVYHMKDGSCRVGSGDRLASFTIATVDIKSHWGPFDQSDYHPELPPPALRVRINPCDRISVDASGDKNPWPLFWLTEADMRKEQEAEVDIWERFCRTKENAGEQNPAHHPNWAPWRAKYGPPFYED